MCAVNGELVFTNGLHQYFIMNKYQAYTLRNFRDIPQVKKHLSEKTLFEIEVVGNVLPFKVNNYVVDQLINWDAYEKDPIYILTFPQKEMLQQHHFNEVANAIKGGASKGELKLIANKIRLELNPHPAGQLEQNLPILGDTKLTGVQHKYRETALFFPSQGQTCHAYCTFCFRWPQFVGMNDLKFAMKDTELLISYLKSKPKVTDVLFTGGDPLVMKTKILQTYIEALIDAKIPGLKTIRFGSKALSYWPQRFTTDDDADELLRLFKKAGKSGIHIALMAHFNHSKELETNEVKVAIQRIQETGAVIRTQSPIMRNINDSSEEWSKMWQKQVELGCIPYYMFLARDTGAQDYFAVSLEKAWRIYQSAIQTVSGVARTVRGPSMSAGPGKIQVLGISEVMNQQVFVLQFLQGRNPDWVSRPFFAAYDPHAVWINNLKPAFGKKSFFFEQDYPLKYTRPPIKVATLDKLSSVN